ncbi:M28 family peptidase [Peribacillus cavernae]|uniref:M28 family peptidase n=1 Tax=Peribacillus cavernae TaxID=1674310 RepID=A0A3S0VM26_9BACI|nr:M28 family peptidase [Peribacillus cavernae]MDQ0219239.1 aminopeptidase YwaD [Peribacillus cavernae]RUQ28549.1 M28 family peptidase [Peribacillus cavernae]
MKRPLVSLALATTLTFGAIGTPAALAKPAEVSHKLPVKISDQIVTKKIDVNNIYNTIDYLSRTPRVAGTESEYAAVQYIKKKFESYGFKTEIQGFTFIAYTPPTAIELSVDGQQGELKPRAFTYSVNGTVTGELASAGKGKIDELQNMDLTGKVALIQRGDIPFAEKVLNAAEKGAIGVIIYNNTDGDLNGTLGEDNPNYVPAVSLTKAEGEGLAAKLSNGAVTASIKIEGAQVREETSHNVIATKKPTSQKKANNDIIVIGSHHDSVEAAPGANDDASGTAMTLELARVLKKLPTDTEIRFITFGAEEPGLLGSRHYVENLSDDEINRTIANFNLDMVGSRDAGELVLLTNDGQPNLVTELAQASSTRLNGAPTSFGQGGRSDHVPFAEAGIPAALFIHDPAEPWYHSPEDTIDKISKEKLQDVAEIVGTAVYDRARFDWPKPKKGKKHKAPHLYYEQDIK